MSVPNPTQPGIDLSATTEAANQLVLDGRAGASADVGRQPGVAAEERELEAQIIEAAQRFGVEPGLAAAIIAAEDHTTCPAIQGAAISERVKLIGALSDALGSPLRIAGAYFARTLPARDADGAASAAHAAPRKTAGQPLASCQAGPAGAMIFAQPSAETTPARRVLTQPERRQWVDGVMHF